ncbi:anti-anti-sigma factor [Streptomyces sp. M1013]|uniref:STAS domain-containing protein n=1 Tax=Streptomyces sp. M1013 TaxID=549798 RepID=UPI000978D634|nr:STAS domain-containing protein [Streptomyces sp. M1013]OMI84904.1 anti-anti-sigma factor [Streptomyces sp. M1013]
MTGFSASPTVSVPVPVPVLALGDVLLVTLQGELHDGAAEQLQDDVARRIASSGAPVGGVVIDISGVEIVDSFLGRVLAEIAAAASLLATRTVLAGMRPAVAITLVELGLTLPGLVTALDVEAALSLLGRASLFAPHVHPEGGA